MSKRMRVPSPATVIAIFALFVALGGAAYAVNLGSNDVKSRHIARGAVKGSDIRGKAVSRAKLRDNAVGAAEIAADAVGESELAEDAVSRQKIKAQAVTTPKIADTAVETPKIADGAVTAAKLGPNSVTGAVMKAETTATVDPPDNDCTIDTVPLAGASPDDHVVVTAEPGSADPLVASGEAGTDEVTVHACGFDTDIPATTFNVLVID